MATPLPPITHATDVDEVVARIETVIAWSLENQSRLGYFAALYKRITRAIRTAIAAHKFQDDARMDRFDAAFANRYFDALNGYFHPGQFAAPTHVWRIAFDAAQLAPPIVVQHMLAGINAHIDLDLGLAAWEIMAPGPIDPLHQDFDTVNAVLADQVKQTIDEIDEISPVLAQLYAVLQQYEIDLIDDSLIVFRDSAWAFAGDLSVLPVWDPVKIIARDASTAAFGAVVMNPPSIIALFVNAIAAQESRDVGANITILNQIASEQLIVDESGRVRSAARSQPIRRTGLPTAGG
jgi:Family of unknown function (DUF5995)